MRGWVGLVWIAAGACGQDGRGAGEAIRAQASPPCGDVAAGAWVEGFGAPLGAQPLITDVATTEDGVVAVGWPSQFSVAPLAARYDGEWRDVPVDPENEDLRNVIVLADGTIAMGGTRLTVSDSTSWEPIVEPDLVASGKVPLVGDADGALYYASLGTDDSEVMRWRAGSADSLGVVDFPVREAAIVDEELVVAGDEVREGIVRSLIAVLRDGAWETREVGLSDGVLDLVWAPPHGLFLQEVLETLRVASGTDGPWTDSGRLNEAIAACDGGLFAAWRVDLEVPQRWQLGFFDGSWQELGEPRLGRVPAIAPAAEGVYLAVGEDGGVFFWRW